MVTHHMTDQILLDLAQTVRARRTASGDTSYTRQLLDGGVERCARKLGEEALELVIAAIGQDDEALKGEAADLLYHLVVLLEARGVALQDVLDTLASRRSRSGLEEKASRPKG